MPIKTRTYIPEKDPRSAPARPANAPQKSHGKPGGRHPQRHGGHQERAAAPLRKPAPRAPRTDVLRFIPLGGHEEIGRNCSYFEYNE